MGARTVVSTSRFSFSFPGAKRDLLEKGGFHFPIRILVSGGKKRPARHAGLITFQPAEMLNSPSLSEIPNSAEETAKPSWKRSHRIQQGDQKSVCQIPRRSRRKQTLMKSGRCWFQEAPWRNQKYRLRSFKKGATEF
jgi:hypothetical protein